jgi:nucleoside-diphosphate-sugar epimerase
MGRGAATARLLMPALICFGFGYCAEYFVGACAPKFNAVVGTVRGAERAAALNAKIGDRLRVLPFDGRSASPELRQAIAAADAALVSIPQDDSGDPVLRFCSDDLLHANNLRTIVYLSTVGVYGDHHGDWVNEDTPPKLLAVRARARLAAEQAWQDFGRRAGRAVAILRLAGIYGPERNALVQVARGEARRIVKPGQVFNRIHVGDIAQAIDAAFTRRASGIFNVTDDEPAPPGDVIAFAAQLMGQEPPPEIAFAAAAPTMSQMALSFWQDCRRVKNEKLKRTLGVTLRYPTYREGLRALFAEGQS